MNDIKQKAREMFDESFCRLREDGYMELHNHHAPDLKVFIDQIIDLAIAERDREIVGMIENTPSHTKTLNG